MSRYPDNLIMEELVLYKVKVTSETKSVNLVGKDGEPYVGKVCNVLNFTDNVEYNLWQNKILQEKFKQLKIKVGDVICLINKGLVQSKSSDRKYRIVECFRWNDKFSKLIGSKIEEPIKEDANTKDIQTKLKTT